MAKAPKARLPLEPVDGDGTIPQFGSEDALRAYQARRWMDNVLVFFHSTLGWSIGLAVEVEFVGPDPDNGIPDFKVTAKSMKSDSTVEVNLVKDQVVFFEDAVKAENYRKVRNG
jgi:hypothetical protein